MSQTNADRLVEMLKQLSPDGDVTGLSKISHAEVFSLETVGNQDLASGYVEAIESGMKSIERNIPLKPNEQYVLEAIILPRERPVVDIKNDSYAKPGSPWEHLAKSPVKTKITPNIRSIGRIELPGHPSIPFGGTGFVVGDNLIMTNRHVAEIFADGIGTSRLRFKSGAKSAIDFVQEIDRQSSAPLQVRDVLMIHPHWDMALLKVEGLAPDHPALSLCVESPDDMKGKDIVVIGYPAQDSRNDLRLQMEIFRRRFNIKRLQPGKLNSRQWFVDAYGNRVQPLAHDASTLGGNSGSAVIDVQTGSVVGLHFSGKYLVANYCVPMFELARDNRVVDMGVNFEAQIPSTNEWEDKWEVQEESPIKQKTQRHSTSTASITIPLSITLSIGPTMKIYPNEKPDE